MFVQQLLVDATEKNTIDYSNKTFLLYIFQAII